METLKNVSKMQDIVDMMRQKLMSYEDSKDAVMGDKYRIADLLLKNMLDNINTGSETSEKDRVSEWDDWAQIMHDYVNDTTQPKYKTKSGFDLISITDPKTCIWNILKYAFRIYNGRGKINDLKKICHYAQIAYVVSDGDLSSVGITNEKGD
jgi:hypothetical protein